MRMLVSLMLAVLIGWPSLARATSYLDVLLYGQNQDAISQYQVALTKHAIYVKQGHTNGLPDRSASYAESVLGSPRQFAANLVVPLVMSDAAAQAAISCSGTPRVCTSTYTDADIQYLVDLNWTALCCQ